MTQSEAITAITKLPLPSGMKGIESIERLMEHLADVIVMQEDIIRTAMAEGEAPDWVRLHTQLQNWMLFVAILACLTLVGAVILFWIALETRGTAPAVPEKVAVPATDPAAAAPALPDPNAPALPAVPAPSGTAIPALGGAPQPSRGEAVPATGGSPAGTP